MADGFITGYRDMEGACIAGMSVCVMSAVGYYGLGMSVP